MQVCVLCLSFKWRNKSRLQPAPCPLRSRRRSWRVVQDVLSELSCQPDRPTDRLPACLPSILGMSLFVCLCPQSLLLAFAFKPEDSRTRSEKDRKDQKGLDGRTYPSSPARRRLTFLRLDWILQRPGPLLCVKWKIAFWAAAVAFAACCMLHVAFVFIAFLFFFFCIVLLFCCCWWSRLSVLVSFGFAGQPQMRLSVILKYSLSGSFAVKCMWPRPHRPTTTSPNGRPLFIQYPLQYSAVQLINANRFNLFSYPNPKDLRSFKVTPINGIISTLGAMPRHATPRPYPLIWCGN